MSTTAAPTETTAIPAAAGVSSRLVAAVAIVLLVVVTGGAALYFWPFSGSGHALMLPGTVEIQEVRLSSKVGGRIERILVEEGDTIPAGTEIARIEGPEWIARRRRLTAQLDSAKAALLRARNGPRPEEIAAARAAAQMTEARAALLRSGVRQEQIDQARGEVESLDPQVYRASKELDRIKELVAKKISPPSDLDTIQADYERLMGQSRVARAKLAELVNGFRVEEIAEAEAKAAQAKSQLDLLIAGTRQEDLQIAEAQVADLEAQVAEIDVQLGELVVKSVEPITIEVIPVRVGEIIAANQPVVRALRDQDLWVKAFVPETELGNVRLQQQVHVEVDSHPGQQFPGRIIYISDISEFTPRNVQSVDERRHQVFALKVRVDAPVGVLKSGMAAEVSVPRGGR